MTRGENRDLTRDIIVRVSPARNTLIVEEQKPGDVYKRQGDGKVRLRRRR